MHGTLRKMETHHNDVVDYQLPVGDNLLPLTPYMGNRIALHYTGNIYCVSCGRKTNKSFAQGHCFPCMKKLAACDMCIMKPETCHYYEGTCREPEWGEANCMAPHIVYLANTSGLKVGITRRSQTPTRWMDQGATQALPIYQVSTRLLSGLVEITLAEHIADKTNWRTLLKGNSEPLDLPALRDELKPQISERVQQIRLDWPSEIIEELDAEIFTFNYPVSEFPEKISSHNFDKTPLVTGKLNGIKGQYLLLDTGVINIRKFTGYEIIIAE
ncbi:MAG: DUF2797 domain-containing protein [Proteobacteria bacterium]|jgi:hypothetical protein|nr:DUF2797 domain-containing protein [Pseudomonadota bacterium]